MIPASTVAGLLVLALAGCPAGGSNGPAPPAPTPDLGTASESPAGMDPAKSPTPPVGGTTGNPAAAVDEVPLLTEVDGIPIPRLKVATRTLDLNAPIPAEVGNPSAAKGPNDKARGDTLVVRYESEPKTMNPITENSAVRTYMGAYFNEPLVNQNKESFAYEPWIATSWVLEDSVKLAPNTPGRERQIALGADGKPADVVTLTAPKPPADKKATPPTITLRTTDQAGQPVGKCWVGLYAVKPIVGIPPGGLHRWSNAQGELALTGLPEGEYLAKVGAEVYGLADIAADGTLTLKPGSPTNPLTEELKATGQEALVLAPGSWIDCQKQTYTTLSLRDDVTWSDGAPFTTQDLAFAYAVINNPLVDGDPIRTYYSDLVECTPLSPTVVRMRYRQQYFKAFEYSAGLGFYTPPFHFFADLVKSTQQRELTLEELTPAQEAEQKKWSVHGADFAKFFNTDPTYNRQPLGTGPYKIVRWQTSDRLEMVRNDRYWNKDYAGYLDKLVFKFIPDQVTALQALRTHQIDVFLRVTAEQYFEDLKVPPESAGGPYVKAAWHSPQYSYLGYNMLRPQLQDRRVRLALSMLFDKTSFLKEKLYDEAVVVSGSQYYFGPAYDHSVPPLAYSPETARDLLTEAGWGDTDGDGILDKGGVTMKLVLPLPKGSPTSEAIVQLYQKSLKTVGIQLDVQFQEWASFIEKLRAKDFDLCTLRWAMDLESDPYQIWHSSGAGRESRGSNHVSFDNRKADAMIEALRLTLDQDERLKLHRQFHRLLDAEQPYMFLYCQKDFAVYHPRFRGVKWYRLRPGYDFTEWYVPKELQLRNERD